MFPNRSPIANIVATFVFSAAVLGCGEGGGQILKVPDIKQLCALEPLTYRKTVVYVDLAAVQNSKPESKESIPVWGLTILNKLKLAPRENLTVISVNPNTFAVSEVFDSCFPILTDSEIDKARKTRTIWQWFTRSDPADQMREDLDTFNASLKNALNKIIKASESYQEGATRNVLGAIALDKDRYSDQTAFYRIVIYTEGTIKETESLQTLAERYSTSYSGAEVVVFGVDGSAQDDTLRSKEGTFSDFFLKNWAHLKAFSPALPDQGINDLVPLYPKATRIDGAFEGCGAKGSAKLSLFSEKQCSSADGWLAFALGNETMYVPFEGRYNCPDGKCVLKAECNQSVPPHAKTPYVRKGDKITLSGTLGQELEGALEPATTERCLPGVVKNGGQDARTDVKPAAQEDLKQLVKYTLRFSFQ